MRPRVGVGLWLGQALVGRVAGPAGSRARGPVRCETGRRGKERGLGWAAAPVGPSRLPTREQARSRGARLGWFGYLGQMPLFFFLFLSYSMPWVSHIGIHVSPTRIPPSVVL